MSLGTDLQTLWNDLTSGSILKDITAYNQIKSGNITTQAQLSNYWGNPFNVPQDVIQTAGSVATTGIESFILPIALAFGVILLLNKK